MRHTQGLIAADAPFPVTAAQAAAAAAAEAAGMSHADDQGFMADPHPHPHAQLPRLVVERVVGCGEVDESLVLGWPQVGAWGAWRGWGGRGWDMARVYLVVGRGGLGCAAKGCMRV